MCHANKVGKFSQKFCRMSSELCVRSMQAVSGRRHMGGQCLSQTTIGRRCPSCLATHHLLSQPFISILCHHSAKNFASTLISTLPQESGRLQYFGFSSMDCGIVIRDIGTRDSGGWTCRVSATVAGKHQVSADIVRLFVGNNLSLSKATVSTNYQKHASSVYRQHSDDATLQTGRAQ